LDVVVGTVVVGAIVGWVVVSVGLTVVGAVVAAVVVFTVVVTAGVVVAAGWVVVGEDELQPVITIIETIKITTGIKYLFKFTSLLKFL